MPEETGQGAGTALWCWSGTGRRKCCLASPGKMIRRESLFAALPGGKKGETDDKPPTSHARLREKINPKGSRGGLKQARIDRRTFSAGIPGTRQAVTWRRTAPAARQACCSYRLQMPVRLVNWREVDHQHVERRHWQQQRQWPVQRKNQWRGAVRRRARDRAQPVSSRAGKMKAMNTSVASGAPSRGNISIFSRYSGKADSSVTTKARWNAHGAHDPVSRPRHRSKLEDGGKAVGRRQAHLQEGQVEDREGQHNAPTKPSRKASRVMGNRLRNDQRHQRHQPGERTEETAAAQPEIVRQAQRRRHIPDRISGRDVEAT